MGRKCSVPYCKSNYKTSDGNISTFRFPKNAILRDKWLRNIKRHDFQITNNSCVCIKHFAPHDLKSESEVKEKDRKKKKSF